MPKSVTGFMTSLTNSGAQLMTNITGFGALNYLSPAVSAAGAKDAASPYCQDPEVLRRQIATDPFCNPIFASAPDIDMDENEAILKKFGLIDEKGFPTSTKPDGEPSFAEYVKNCFSGRPGILYTAVPDQAGNASAVDDTCTSSGKTLPGDTIGRYDRFAAQFGYYADSVSIGEDYQ
jgi:hypothetical protein